MTRLGRWWRGWWRGWTGCRWRSSWPRRGGGGWAWRGGWVEARGVAGLLDRIGDRFALLTEGDRGAADRQRSLAATVEWSYRLLEERERRVFRAVSVFPGPFTLEGAEAVAGAAAGPGGVRLGGLFF